jgi:hypothetical protein
VITTSCRNAIDLQAAGSKQVHSGHTAGAANEAEAQRGSMASDWGDGGLLLWRQAMYGMSAAMMGLA